MGGGEEKQSRPPHAVRRPTADGLTPTNLKKKSFPSPPSPPRLQVEAMTKAVMAHCDEDGDDKLSLV